jgi:lipopolysaccharide transport system ATP-binding protein
MSADVVICAEGLGKKYVIGHETEREPYTTLRDVATRTARDVWKRVVDVTRGRAIVQGCTTEEFWALKDVNFEVKRGEVLGIIGRNGAGKSTLLKILSRITEPSQGRVTIEGRVASLLEVGTGFHPELTGRENIYLNGVILGMRRAEIRRKFDEIVAFAEIDKFLDTPVKRYSSGMYVRLAFAVAAHLEPEILVVDEVLAVGDTEFQNKCIGQMKRVASEGRTILFVSHNLSAVSAMCEVGIVMTNGTATPKENAAHAISRYRNQLEAQSAGSLAEWRNRSGNGQARITDFRIGTIGTSDGVVRLDLPITFEFTADFYEPVPNPSFGVLVHDSLGEILLDLRSSSKILKSGTQAGTRRITATVPTIGLVPGHYLVSLWVNNERESEDIDYVKTCGSFQVLEAQNTARRGPADRAGAKFWVASDWTIDAP